MVETENDLFIMGGYAVSPAAVRTLVTSKFLSTQRPIILEALVITSSAGASAEVWEIIYAGRTIHNEQLSYANQMTLFGLPFYKIAESGLLEIYVNAAAGARTYGATLEGKYVAA
jgi:hypothetical protein